MVTDERGARRDYLLLVAALFSLLMGGHPETILYVAIVGACSPSTGSFIGLPASGRHGWPAGFSPRRSPPGWRPPAGSGVPAHPQSLRHHWIEVRNERMGESPLAPGSGARPGLGKRVVLVFAPNAFGNSRYGDYWGDANNNEDATAFVGGAAILAALLAFLPARRRFREERIFLALAPLSLLIAVRIPGMPLLLSSLPVLNQSISSNRRMLLLVAFSFAWLGACTVERWRTGEGPRRGAVLLGGAILIGAIAWGYLLSAHIPELAALRWFWVGTQLAAVAGAAGVDGLRERRGREPAITALCALVAVELLVIHRPANPSLPRSAYYPTTPLVRFLQENAGGSRIAGLANRMLPNANLVYGLADIRISDPLKPFSYVQAVGPVSASIRSTEHILIKAGAPHLPAPRGALGGGAAADELDPRPAGGLPRSHRTGVRAGAGAPPALPPRLRRERGGEAVALLARREPRLRGPRAPGLRSRQPAGRRPGPRIRALEILAANPARLEARARLAEERLLASSVYQDGGWRLLLDGRLHPTTIANGPFVAAWLPAGEHRVDLVYRAPGFMAGLGLAALALAGLVIWLLAPAPTRTRPRPPPAPSACMSGTSASGAG